MDIRTDGRAYGIMYVRSDRQTGRQAGSKVKQVGR